MPRRTGGSYRWTPPVSAPSSRHWIRPILGAPCRGRRLEPECSHALPGCPGISDPSPDPNREPLVRAPPAGDSRTAASRPRAKHRTHGSLNATPKTLWNAFSRRSEKEGKPGRLVTVMSTRSDSKHGHEDNDTEVPRRTLVKELKQKQPASIDAGTGTERRRGAHAGIRSLSRALHLRRGTRPNREH